MIDFKSVTKIYGRSRTKALENVSFNIEKGEFISIVGFSGAGKSTLFKMILGEEEPTSGRVYFNKKRLDYFDDNEVNEHRRKIGVIFQDFKLLKNKNVYENIAFSMETAGFSDEQIAVDVPYVLDLVNLKDKMWSFTTELSGGEKQRVAIARAIVSQPDLILADEPTGNLDPISSYEILDILKQINKNGTTIILTTHDKNVVDNLRKRVITLENGIVKRDEKVGQYIL